MEDGFEDEPMMPGKLVFTFPGQGSFAPDLLRKMYDTRAGLRPLFYAVDQASGDILGEPFLPMVLGDPSKQSGSRDLDQLGIYLANYATAQLWLDRGVTPDALLGHSFGELAAFATAGIFSFEDGARMVCQRVLSLRESATPGKMVAVSANDKRVQAMLNEFALASVISVVNHPEQTVVSGPEEELAELRLRFAKEAVSVTLLASNYPFHSPLLAGSSRAFRIASRGHRFAVPQYPVMVGTDLAWVGSETDVTDAMARQLVTPLNFVELVGKYQAAGYSRFIECGGGTIVTKVIARVLKTATTPHQEWATFPVAADINDSLAAIEREMNGSAPAPESARTPAAPASAPASASARVAPAPAAPVALAAPVPPAAPAAPARVAPVAPVAPAKAVPTEPIAIVGMGCVLPGGADSPDQYWKNITTGVSGIVDLADSVP